MENTENDHQHNRCLDNAGHAIGFWQQADEVAHEKGYNRYDHQHRRQYLRRTIVADACHHSRHRVRQIVGTQQHQDNGINDRDRHQDESSHNDHWADCPIE